MAYAALVSLAQTTDLILNPLKYSIHVGEKEKIISIREYTNFLISFFEDFPRKTNRLEGRIRCVANEAEILIEYFMLKQIHHGFWSVRVSSVEFEPQLKRVREEFGLITGDMMDERLDGSPAAVISSTSRLASTGKNDTVIGLGEELMAIKDRLCGLSSKLEFIPILGMGGIGKTTLARCAFDDQLTVEYFYIRVWIKISQDYSAQKILSCLRNSMKSFDEKMLAHEDEATMREKVYKSLKGRKYLIVMDDVWSTKVLDDVRNIFPDDHMGSRIVLTTRITDVATYAISRSPVHEMKFMDDDQCWNLLKQKVFTSGNVQVCPSELEDVGKEIAKSCSGLPLAVVLLAGVLSKVAETRDSWEEIAKNVNSIVGGQLDEILSLSYTHLPHHLRSCFLYMGGFPEDHEIHVSELFKMWVADGFLRRVNEFRSLEEEAEEYLEDLVERRLVLVTNRKSTGKIKSCSLHDLVRDMCIRKAREEKFLVHAADWCTDVRRFIVTNPDNLNVICGSALRTVLYFQQLEASSSGSLDFLERSKLVRVLSVANDRGGELPSQIYELFHLRFLALPNLANIPSAIYKLENLHTLIIKPKYKKSMRKFELEICRMPQLRHLVVYSFIVSPYFFAHGLTLPLENLQTLSGLLNPLCSKKFLKMFPHVKKLGLIFIHYDGDQKKAYQLHNLACLDKLEKLKITVNMFRWVEQDLAFPRTLNKLTLPGIQLPRTWRNMNKFHWVEQDLAFPRTLKKLTLSGMQLPWRYMTIVGSLPDLEVLKLINHNCHGDTWETADGEFPRLKFLQIEQSTLQFWKTERSHFPVLECLILHKCQFLMQIPAGIAEIPSLEMIEVDFINKLLVKSAEEILEDQRSNGNDCFQVRMVDCLHLSSSVEKMSGKICYMIGAMELEIAHFDDPEKWQWKSCADSRFSVVAYLKKVLWLDITVRIKTQILSPNTAYAAYLVFKLAADRPRLRKFKNFTELQSYNGDAEEASILVHLWQRANAGHGPQRANAGDAEETSILVHLRDRVCIGHGHGHQQKERYPVRRDDGWMEVEMGSFFNDDDDGEVEARLNGIGSYQKSGFFIEGIEFRPKTQFGPEES